MLVFVWGALTRRANQRYSLSSSPMETETWQGLLAGMQTPSRKLVSFFLVCYIQHHLVCREGIKSAHCSSLLLCTEYPPHRQQMAGKHSSAIIF